MFRKYSATSVHMNTQVKFITWSDLEGSEILNYFELGFQEFERIEKLYSRFKSDSYLSQFNSKATPKVTQEFFEITSFLLLFAYKTDGVFDPTIIDILETYGYDKNYNFKKLDDKIKLENELKKLTELRSSFKDIILEIKTEANDYRGNIEDFANLIKSSNQLQRFFTSEFYNLYKFLLDSKVENIPEYNLEKINSSLNIQYFINLAENQRIEFGGCGKGFAIDKAFEKLKPLKNFIIDAGGDIRCFGEVENRKWNASLFATNQAIELSSGDSFCCSGPSARRVKYFHHLINPKTAKPENEYSQVFVYCGYEKAERLNLLATYNDAFSTYSFIKGEMVENELKSGVFAKFLK